MPRKKAEGAAKPKGKPKPAAKNASEPKNKPARTTKVVPPDVKLVGRITAVGAAVKEKPSDEGFVKPEAIMRVTFECKMRPELMSAVSALAMEHVNVAISAVQTSLAFGKKDEPSKKGDDKKDPPAPAAKEDAAKTAGDHKQLEIPE